MAIKPGDVAYIRTTDEPVFVIDITERGPAGVVVVADDIATAAKLSNTTVKVRRPIGTDSAGISHSVETFYLEELEDEDSHKKRRSGGLLNLFGTPGMVVGGDDTLASN